MVVSRASRPRSEDGQMQLCMQLPNGVSSHSRRKISNVYMPGYVCDCWMVSRDCKGQPTWWLT